MAGKSSNSVIVFIPKEVIQNVAINSDIFIINLYAISIYHKFVCYSYLQKLYFDNSLFVKMILFFKTFHVHLYK